MMVEEGEGGCPEGSVSRPVRERQLSRQRGAQREGAGGGAPTSLCYAHTGLPYLRGLSSTAASIPRTLLCSGPVLSCTAGSPCSTWVSGPVLSRAGAFPAAHGSVVLFSVVRGLSLQHVGQGPPRPQAEDFPCSTWVSGPVLSRAGTFPAARGSGSTPSLEHQPPSLLTFSSRLQGPLSPGFLGPIWLLLLPFLPTSKRWWASEVGPQTASLSRSEVLIFLVP